MPSVHNGQPSPSDLSLAFNQHNGFVELNGQLSPVITSSHGPLMDQNEQQLMLDLSHYKPELKADENPNYYQANRVLFEAHKERITREVGQKSPHSQTVKLSSL